MYIKHNYMFDDLIAPESKVFYHACDELANQTADSQVNK